MDPCRAVAFVPRGRLKQEEHHRTSRGADLVYNSVSKKRSCSFSKPALFLSTNISQDVTILYFTMASLCHLLKRFLSIERKYRFVIPRPVGAKFMLLDSSHHKLLSFRHTVQFLLKNERVSLVKCELGHSSVILVLIHCWHFWSSLA